MKRMALTSGVLVIALTASAVFLASAKARAQTGSPEAAPTTTLQTGTSLVVVPALVQTTARELVFSLTADDFTLTDNGVPQKVTLETDAARPLSLVVLMQTGGAARSHFKNYENLEAMLAAVLGGTPNQVSIVSFDSRIEGASPFTSDIAQWRDAVNHPDPGNSGAAIFDGLDYALDLLKQQPANSRRAILLLSQEHDDGSQTKLKDIIRTVGETDTAVYSLTFSAEKTTLKQDFKQPGPPNRPITVGDREYVQYFQLTPALNLAIGAMRKNMSAEVANLSGGEASSFDNKAELDQNLGILTNHLRNSYILSFTPSSRKPGLHTIQVRLAHHPDLRVTARTNYWSADATETAPTH
jgi:VWFA-related protein